MKKHQISKLHQSVNSRIQINVGLLSGNFYEATPTSSHIVLYRAEDGLLHHHNIQIIKHMLAKSRRRLILDLVSSKKNNEESVLNLAHEWLSLCLIFRDSTQTRAAKITHA
jgi:hypothetical protein